jgi:hypothetical protein
MLAWSAVLSLCRLRSSIYCIYIKHVTCTMYIILNLWQWTKHWWQWLTEDRPDLSSEKAPHGDNTATFRQKKLVTSSRVNLTPRHTDWLTVSRNMTLTWNSSIDFSKWRQWHKRVGSACCYRTELTAGWNACASDRDSLSFSRVERTQ